MRAGITRNVRENYKVFRRNQRCWTWECLSLHKHFLFGFGSCTISQVTWETKWFPFSWQPGPSCSCCHVQQPITIFLHWEFEMWRTSNTIQSLSCWGRASRGESTGCYQASEWSCSYHMSSGRVNGISFWSWVSDDYTGLVYRRHLNFRCSWR